jgi:hypothetical protein
MEIVKQKSNFGFRVDYMSKWLILSISSVEIYMISEYEPAGLWIDGFGDATNGSTAGYGDAANAGGSGMVFIDDIRSYRP